jgi:hypothetical protein
MPNAQTPERWSSVALPLTCSELMKYDVPSIESERVIARFAYDSAPNRFAMPKVENFRRPRAAPQTAVQTSHRE